MPLVNTPSLEQASIYSDLNSLDAIRRQGQTDQMGAIKKAAQEFESFFLNMMLKSMRQASDVIGSDNPFSSQQEKMYTGMMDEQLSVNLSQGGHLKIADLMVEQLSRKTMPVKGSVDFTEHLKNIGKQAKFVGVSSADESKAINSNLQNHSINTETKNIERINLAKTSEVKTSDTQTSLNTAIEKPSKKSLFNRINDFVDELLPIAKKAAEKLNIDPKLLLAQAALETGWGQYVMHDGKGKPGYNLFGIKAGNNWKGESINIDTIEVSNQQVSKVNAAFRKYDSFAESFSDYVDFISNNPRYEKALNFVSEAHSYLKELQQSGYATDPNYAEKIMRIYQDEKIQNTEL